MSKRIAALLVLVLLLCCAAPLAQGDVSVGSKVTFGNYPQTMRGFRGSASPEPIRWLVLAVEGDKALLLSEQALAGKDYNSPDHFLYEVTWETCTLRAWLNNEFLNEAFSSREQQAIIPANLQNPGYESGGFVVSGGNDTTDKVFILSPDEAEKYLPTEASRRCYPTEYAESNGAYIGWSYYEDDSKADSDSGNSDDDKERCIWWLRAPGPIGHYAAACETWGEIDRWGEYVAKEGFAVRPAVWVSVSALTAGR